MPRGRPTKSEIRQRIVDILQQVGEAYGYKIHKIYCDIFPKCTREVVYYHLRKGVKLQEFIIKEVKLEKGDYSWGNAVEKIYYALGPKAMPSKDPQIIAYFQALKANPSEQNPPSE